MEKETPESPGGDSSHLFDFLQGGNLDLAISESKRFLAEDPEDKDAHFCLALALLDLEQNRDAKPHVDFLLENYPENPNTHLAATVLAKNKSAWRKVRHHTAEGMRIEPENSIFYFYAAIADMAQMKFDAARVHLDKALQLDPEDTDYINLSVRLSSINQTTAVDAWKRIDEYKNALKLDPSNPVIHDSLGDTYLDDLDSPKEAEFHYREALSIDPKNKEYQKSLFNAVAKRDLIYRLFSLPSRTFTFLGYLMYAIRYQPWRIIFLIIGFKFVTLFVVWLAMVTLLFWPAGKIYEWLLVSELKTGAAASIGHLKAWHWFHRWPRWLRLGTFLLGFAAVYAGIFMALGAPLKIAFTVLGILVGVHFVIVLFCWSLKQSARKAAQKQNEKLKPPPLPAG